MAYSELVKNFEKVRGYMRQFYVYGFKSRSEYQGKSPRSYDDERRRIESWLGDYMGFAQTSEGKNVFLSVDSRVVSANPFYKAWKTKSFTDGDITLHFLLFDLLPDPAVAKTLGELVAEIDRALEVFETPMTFDESTVRKKLKEYVQAGLICMEKQGKRTLYRRSAPTDLSGWSDALDFFTEAAPCGVIGSYLVDRQPPHTTPFCFKHHYMTQALDSGILAQLFDAMQGQRYITVDNLSRHAPAPKTLRLVPLRIYISAQNGRQNLIAWHEQANRINTYRLDYLTNLRTEEVCPEFEALRSILSRMEAHMWGVNCKSHPRNLERVEFELRIGPEEGYILRRLEREKRCGRIEQIDDSHYRFVAEVFDTNEMLPWIRTFLCRITRMHFSNRTAENQFKADIQELYRMYGLDGGGAE